MARRRNLYASSGRPYSTTSGGDPQHRNALLKYVFTRGHSALKPPRQPSPPHLSAMERESSSSRPVNTVLPRGSSCLVCRKRKIVSSPYLPLPPFNVTLTVTSYRIVSLPHRNATAKSLVGPAPAQSSITNVSMTKTPQRKRALKFCRTE
jgi:hypothetical protein